MTADGSTDIFAANAARAVRSIHGVSEDSFTIVPFYPENFIVHCHSREVRDLLLATPAMPVVATSLVLHP